MDRNRFVALTRAYGGDISRWPPETRAAAERLAEAPWARSALAEAGLVDALFSDAEDSVDARRTARAISRVGAAIARPRRDWWQWLAPVSALAAAGVMGVVFGTTTIQAASASVGMGDMLVAMLRYSDPVFGLGFGG